MDELSALASRTRTLEQEYTSRIVRKYADELRQLRGKLAAQRAEQPSPVSPHELEAANKQLREDYAAVIQELAALKKEKARESAAPKRRQDGTKENAANQQGGAGDTVGLASLAETQAKILRAMDNLTMAREDYKAHTARLDKELERLRTKNSKLEEEVARLKNKNGGSDPHALRLRITELEGEVRALQDCKLRAETADAAIGDQKDTIALLRDSLASKDKVIERLTAQVARMKAQSEKLPGNLPEELIKPQRSIIDAFANNTESAVTSGAVPSGPGKKPRRATKPTKKPQGPAKDPALVSVQDLIRDENKSFFNNLSFTNSSPMPDKKGKKRF